MDRTTLPRGFHKTMSISRQNISVFLKLLLESYILLDLIAIHPVLKKTSQLLYSFHGKWFIASKQRRTHDSTSTFQVKH